MTTGTPTSRVLPNQPNHLRHQPLTIGEKSRAFGLLKEGIIEHDQALVEDFLEARLYSHQAPAQGLDARAPHNPGGLDPPLATVAFVHGAEDRNRQGALRRERAETRKKKSRHDPRISAHPPRPAHGGPEHRGGASLHPPARCGRPSSHQIQAVVRDAAAPSLIRRFVPGTPRPSGKKGGSGAFLEGSGAGPTLSGASYSRYAVALRWHVRIVQGIGP